MVYAPPSAVGSQWQGSDRPCTGGVGVAGGVGGMQVAEATAAQCVNAVTTSVVARSVRMVILLRAKPRPATAGTPEACDCKTCAEGFIYPGKSARAIPQKVIDQHQCDHCLTHRNESWEQTRVVSALDENLRRLAGSMSPCSGARGMLLVGLDRHPANDRLPAGDAAEHSAVAIGFQVQKAPEPTPQRPLPSGRGGEPRVMKTSCDSPDRELNSVDLSPPVSSGEGGWGGRFFCL